MVVVHDVEKLQFKFYQNRIRLRGVNTYFWVSGTIEKSFFFILGSQNFEKCHDVSTEGK